MANYTPLCSVVTHTPRRRNQLQIAREAAGLSKKELAKRAGISPTTVYMIEDGLLDSRVSTLVRIAEALNVDPGMLISKKL